MVKKSARKGKQEVPVAEVEGIAPPDAWEEIGGVTETLDLFGKRVPVNRIDTLCTVGMIVAAVNGPGNGMVIQLTSSHCIVQYENGEIDAVPWIAISIECVIPAGMPLARPYGTESTESKAVEKLYPPANPLPLPTLNRAEVKS